MPIWVVAAAKAAAQVLNAESFDVEQTIDFFSDEESVKVPIRSASLLQNGEKALGICNCQSIECLDITRDLEIWACLEYSVNENQKSLEKEEFNSGGSLQMIPGYGVGRISATNEISISKFASQLLSFNLKPFLRDGFLLKVEIIFPLGKELAKKTSNHAFGVVDGLALIGTQADVQVSASPEQLKKTIESLREKCSGEALT